MKERIFNLVVNSWWVAIFALVFVGSCIHDPFIDPLTLNNGQSSTPGCVSNGLVCFESSVLPIFLSSCAKSGCHDAVSHKEGFVLNNYNNIVREGIKPGNANESKLYRVLFASGEDRMPPDAALTLAQKDSIKTWINQGAQNTVKCNCSCDTTKFTYSAVILPILSNSCVGCHNVNSLGGNVDLSTYTKVKIQVSNGKLVGSITHSIGYVAMPNGGKLPDCEIKQIKKWVGAGALNN